MSPNLEPRVLSPTRPYGARETGRRENLGTRCYRPLLSDKPPVAIKPLPKQLGNQEKD